MTFMMTSMPMQWYSQTETRQPRWSFVTSLASTET